MIAALGLTAVRGALRRGLSFYVTLGIVVTILFAGNGLDASTVTRFAERSPLFSGALLCAWLVGTMPVARALLQAHDAQFIKGLAVSSRAVSLVLGLFLCVAETPWALLWLRGRGPKSGVAALLVAVALHSLWLARPFPGVRALAGARVLSGVRALSSARVLSGGRERALRVAVLGVVASTWASVPALLVTLAVAPVCLFCVRAAWLGDVDTSGAKEPSFVGGPRIVALAVAHALALVRAHAHVLLRSVALVSLAMAMALAILMHRAPRHIDEVAALLHGVLGPAIVAGSASVAGPMLRTERLAWWLFESTGLEPRGRESAMVIVVAVSAALLGSGGATVATIFLGANPLDRVAVALDVAAAMASLAVLAERGVRFAVRGDGRDGARMLVSLSVVLALGLVPLVVSPHVATLTTCALSLATWAGPLRVRSQDFARGSLS